MKKTGAACLPELLRAALEGGTVPWGPELTPREVTALRAAAAAHKVLPMAASVLAKSGVPESPEMRALLRAARGETLAQAGRTAEFLDLYGRLSARGLRPLVVKGAAVRGLYPAPEQRPSLDEDLLAEPGTFEDLCAALSDLGLMPEEGADPARDAEVSFVSADGKLLLEAHRFLFDPASGAYGGWDALLSGAHGRAEEIRVCGTFLRVPCPADHLLYMILHALKHFLHGGFGIRQVCDIGLLARAREKEIDWERVLAGCRAVRADAFAAALFRICEEELGLILPPAFAGIDTDPSDLLSDILSGGVYGTEDPDRARSATITLRAAGRKKEGLLRTLFPSAAELSGRYPYLKKRPFLLPAAWAARLWRYAGERRKGEADPSRSLSIGRERTELLKKYRIIE